MPKRKPTALDNWLSKRSTPGVSVSKNDANQTQQQHELEKSEASAHSSEETESSEVLHSLDGSEKLVESGEQSEIRDEVTLQTVENRNSSNLTSMQLEETGDSSSTTPVSPCCVTSSSDDTKLSERACHFPKVPTQTLNGKQINFQEAWYKIFPWLHYDQRLEKVLCYECVRATKLQLHGNNTIRDEKFLTVGFCNWRKGSEKFKKHESSSFHKASVSLLISLTQDAVTIQLESSAARSQEKARIYLSTIFTTTMFLAKQALPLRGDSNDEGNFMNLLQVRSKDVKGFSAWLQRSKSFTSWAIQNEVLQIVAHSILRQTICKIRKAKYFSIIVDETSDVSILEQVSINIRIVNDAFEPEEYFLGLYETPRTTGSNLVSLILDSLRRFNLPLEDLRGQCYDGAANMAGKFNGVQAQILKLNPRALYVHCHNHCLNLALQDSAKSIVFVRDILATVHELGTLIRGSPKRMAQFNQLCENDESISIRPRPLCPTRWTVRVKSIEAVLSSYEKYLVLLEDLSTSHDKAAVKERGLRLQMEKGEFWIGLLMAKTIFLPCERLSKILQNADATIFGSTHAAEIAVLELSGLKNAEKFEEMWELMLAKASEIDLQQPQLPRQRSVPKRFKTFDVHREFESAKQKLCSSYFDFIETIVSDIERRFKQPGVSMYGKCESALLKYPAEAEKEPDLTNELFEVCNFYDWSFGKLKSQLDVLINLKRITWDSLSSIVEDFKRLSSETRAYFPEVSLYLNHLMVIPCSSAGAERSFSMLRRIKTYLRSNMRQDRLNHCCVINAYRDDVDSLNLEDLMREFVSKGNRDVTFGANW